MGLFKKTAYTLCIFVAIPLLCKAQYNDWDDDDDDNNFIARRLRNIFRRQNVKSRPLYQMSPRQGYTRNNRGSSTPVVNRIALGRQNRYTGSATQPLQRSVNRRNNRNMLQRSDDDDDNYRGRNRQVQSRRQSTYGRNQKRNAVQRRRQTNQSRGNSGNNRNARRNVINTRGRNRQAQPLSRTNYSRRGLQNLQTPAYRNIRLRGQTRRQPRVTFRNNWYDDDDDSDDNDDHDHNRDHDDSRDHDHSRDHDDSRDDDSGHSDTDNSDSNDIDDDFRRRMISNVWSRFRSWNNYG